MGRPEGNYHALPGAPHPSMHRSILLLTAACGLSGCAATNDSGVPLFPKPDLSGITPGMPINKVASLKKPVKKEPLTNARPPGAELWVYEWDLPDDGVNNRMFTSVVVKDGIILEHTEETADKWRQNEPLHMKAKVESALEDVASLNATAARQQRSAFLHAHHDPATHANTWDLLTERTRSVQRDHAAFSSLRYAATDAAGSPAVAEPSFPDAAETPAPGPAEPAPFRQLAVSETVAEVVLPPKTLRELEAEELLIRKDGSLTRKERLRRLHEVWKQQREVMGQGDG